MPPRQKKAADKSAVPVLDRTPPSVEELKERKSKRKSAFPVMAHHSTAVTVQERVLVVMELLLDELGTSEILEYSNALGWGVCRRTVDTYIATARKEIKKRQDRDADYNFAKAQAQLRQFYRNCMSVRGTPGALSAGLGALRELYKIQGLATPLKLEHSGPDGGPIETTGPQVVVYLPDNGRDK